MAIEHVGAPAKRCRGGEGVDSERKGKRSKRESEEEFLADCLVRLARTGDDSGGGTGTTSSSCSSAAIPVVLSVDPPSVQNNSYRCEDCGKSFTSFQAFGGHKASHRIKPHQPAETFIGDRCSLRRNPMVTHRIHECSICHKNFPTGQALGGHKRKHYEGVIGRKGTAKAFVNSSEDGGSGRSIVTSSYGDDGDSTAVRDFDLNFPPPLELSLMLSYA